MGRYFNWQRLTGTLLCAVLLGSCGGGGGYAGIDGSGAKPELSVVGPINGFGSVIVNGVHYNTDQARVYVRGEPASEIDLNVGDYVTVVGGTNAEGEPVAYEVHYQPRVTGEIQWIDVERNQLSVLGQVIQLLVDTVYASDIMPQNIHGLSVGKHISISGPLDANRVIQATRIGFDESSFAELVGSVEQLNVFARTFVVNGQLVSYASVASSSGLSNGRLVVVRGSVVDEVLEAEELSFHQDYRNLRHIPRIELSGIIQETKSDGLFIMDSVPVKTTSQTTFSGGDAASLTANAKVRVIGSIDANDVLIAQEVKILSSPHTKIYGSIQEVYPIWGYYWLLGKIKVQDQEFLVQADTRLTGEYDRRINFWDLRIGDQVYISSYTWGDLVIASSIAVDNRDVQAMPADLMGGAYFLSESTQSFFIFGTKIVVGPGTLYKKGEAAIDSAEFFRSGNGAFVRVLGYYEYGYVRATQIQIYVPDYSKPYTGVPGYYGKPR